MEVGVLTAASRAIRTARGGPVNGFAAGLSARRGRFEGCTRPAGGRHEDMTAKGWFVLLALRAVAGGADPGGNATSTNSGISASGYTIPVHDPVMIRQDGIY